VSYLSPPFPLITIYGALTLWTAGIMLAILRRRISGHALFAWAMFLGSAILVAGAVFGLQVDITWEAPRPIYFGVAPFVNRLDNLSSIFLGLLGLCTAATAIFSPAYLDHLGSRFNPRLYWVCKNLFLLSMAEVVLSGNVLTFLVFWELMSLSSAVLVASDHSNTRVQRAALIYLGATRIATAFLAAGFLWLHSLFHSWTFADWHLADKPCFWPALLILIGLSIKAGVWPFYIWLPYAHPAAPAPVSALMSGVMIKVALYAMIRLLVLGGVDTPLIQHLALALGIISAFWGVLFALAQQDLKRLLAFSSIENVGLILTGLALSMYCRSANLPDVASLALAAALFHCFNHGLFKSLLFLGAGTLDSQAGTRDLSLLGGLSRKMPWTMASFLMGSIAICCLPPLNGFASKWLLYQSLFQLACQTASPVSRAISLACIGTMALVGGLAVACFTEAFGIAFLGQARSQLAERAHEKENGMVIAQILLAVCCIFTGLTAPSFLQAFQPVCFAATHSFLPVASAFSIPMSILALFLLATVWMIRVLLMSGKPADVRRYITWECGYGELSHRSEATSISFVHSIEYIFRHLLQYRTQSEITGADRRHFPEKIKVETETQSLLELRVYAPLIRILEWLGRRFATLQAGSIHLYLLYMLLTLITLVAVGTI